MKNVKKQDLTPFISRFQVLYCRFESANGMLVTLT
jgi:hypothetical protein